jgi:hypothetical protein
VAVTENVENLILEMLRRMDQRMQLMADDLSDIKLRVTATEEHLASIMMSIAGLNSRMEIAGRVSRIERRMNLTDAGDAR